MPNSQNRTIASEIDGNSPIIMKVIIGNFGSKGISKAGLDIIETLREMSVQVTSVPVKTGFSSPFKGLLGYLSREISLSTLLASTSHCRF